ncbi:MAG: ATP-binding protein [Bacteroidales bacterium]|nr:ATP-binding protein [Bacteroidales bacterium]
MDLFVGRDKEIRELDSIMCSNRSEFVIIYGRRRVGKTFLIQNYFQKRFAFSFVGWRNQPLKSQLDRFSKSISQYFKCKKVRILSSWIEAFDLLEEYIDSINTSEKKVIFFDEMPWIDTKQSEFVEALEYFWNSWANNRDDIIFVACGSATSWMVDKLIDNQGGLHNRITRRIYLRPFNLCEVRQYLANKDFDWDFYQIIQLYMVVGGVPFYLSLLDNRLSLEQNIDALFFRSGGLLQGEFDELYNALFSKADSYILIVKALSDKREGLSRSEIEQRTKISGGTLTKILKNLERCDFIVTYSQFKCKSKYTLYRLKDFFTLFYYKFIEGNNTKDENFWQHASLTHSVESWEGFSFELVCYVHLQQIKKALGISGIFTETSTWRYIPNSSDTNSKGSQVDLVISRIDKIIHLIEIKFSSKKFTITKDYYDRLKSRKELFAEVNDVSRGLVDTFITPYGLSDGKYKSLIHSEITAEYLFEKE